MEAHNMDTYMDTVSLHNHNKHRFGRVGWNPGSQTCVQSIPLCNDWGCTTFHIPYSSDTYNMYVSTFFFYSGWVDVGTLTLLPLYTITHVSADLGELSEILGHKHVHMMQLCYGWDFRTFSSASHIHLVHKCVWAPSSSVDVCVWMDFQTIATTNISPNLGE